MEIKLFSSLTNHISDNHEYYHNKTYYYKMCFRWIVITADGVEKGLLHKGPDNQPNGE